MNGKMHLLLCLNRSLYRQLFVLLVSIYRNNPPENIFLHIFETDFREEEKEFLCKYMEAGGGGDIYHITPEMLSGFAPAGRITIEAYCRLLAVDILPRDVERVLYLDIDTIVDKPIDRLYYTDFDGAYLCACPTPLAKLSFEEFVKVEDKGQFSYFNSGMLLLNLAKLREDGYTRENFVHAFAELLQIARKREPVRTTPYQQDQGVLNYMFGVTAKYLPSYRYNYRPCHYYVWDKENLSEAKENDTEFGTIIHYTCDGMGKPWWFQFDEGNAVYSIAYPEERNRFLYGLNQRWWHYALFSPFYDSLHIEAKAHVSEYLRSLAMRSNVLRWRDRDKLYGCAVFFQKLCTRLSRSPSYVADFLRRHHYESVAFYGKNMVSDELRLLLKDSGIQVAYLVTSGSVPKIPNVSVDATEFPEADVLIIADLLNADNVKEKLKKYISFPIISAEEIFNT